MNKTTQRRSFRAMICFALALILMLGAAPFVFAAPQTIPASLETYNPYKGLTYQHNARFEGYTVKTGIDISTWNVVDDWAAVKAAGVDYVIIRTGNRFSESGTLGEDSHFLSHIQGAISQGFDIGVYFFSQAVNAQEAQQEAAEILRRIEPYRQYITLPVVIDFEFIGSTGGRLYAALNQTRQQQGVQASKDHGTGICRAFCQAVEQAGYKPMVYANRSTLEGWLNASEIETFADVWLASYDTFTTYRGQYLMWQHTSTSRINGISGNVDCNFMYLPPSTSGGSDPVIPSIPNVPNISKDDLATLQDITTFIDGYAEGTTYAQIYSDLESKSADTGLHVGVRDPQGNLLKETDVIKTNDLVFFFDANGTIREINVIVLHGDINSDGAITLLDIMNMHQFLKGVKQMEGGVRYAADVNGDNTFSLMDIMNMHQHIKGSKPITQHLFG